MPTAPGHWEGRDRDAPGRRDVELSGKVRKATGGLAAR